MSDNVSHVLQTSFLIMILYHFQIMGLQSLDA